jgi:hypothetical protein
LGSVTANESAIGLCYEGLRIAVQSTPASHLRWLEEFLTPAFTVGVPQPSDWRVAVREDGARYAAIVGRGPIPNTAPLACFGLDHDWIRLPRWKSTIDVRAVVDEQWRVAYEVDPVGRNVVLVAEPGTLALRTSLMRVVRELAMRHAQRRGGIFLHAAALAIGTRGLILAGEKDAGKTTLLVSLLRHDAARYVANDRVLVGSAAATTPLRGMPTVVSIRPGTLQFFPHLRRELAASGFNYRQTVKEVAAAPDAVARPWQDGRFGVSPAQLCSLLGVEQVGTCEISALLFPRIVRDELSIGLRQLKGRDAAERLARAVFGSAVRLERDRLWSDEDESCGYDDRLLAARVKQLADAVPCFECRMGRNAHTSVSEATEIASRLVA